LLDLDPGQRARGALKGKKTKATYIWQMATKSGSWVIFLFFLAEKVEKKNLFSRRRFPSFKTRPKNLKKSQKK
jgi:hypothetical protein